MVGIVLGLFIIFNGVEKGQSRPGDIQRAKNNLAGQCKNSRNNPHRFEYYTFIHNFLHHKTLFSFFFWLLQIITLCLRDEFKLNNKSYNYKLSTHTPKKKKKNIYIYIYIQNFQLNYKI